MKLRKQADLGLTDATHQVMRTDLAGMIEACGGQHFRQRGIVAYGVSPFKVNYYDVDGAHGADERIRSRFFAEGVRLMRTIVRDFCAAK